MEQQVAIMGKGLEMNVIKYAAISVLALSANANASQGLTDLENALNSLKDTTAISATLFSTYNQDRGKKESEVKNTSGSIKVKLNMAPEGMQVTYFADTLDKVDREKQLKADDEEALTPTLNAMERLETTSMKNMLSASQELSRFLTKAEFEKEEKTELLGVPARRLYFNLPLDSIVSEKETREYVDEFEGKYSLIINEQGVPLQAIMSFSGSGSAFIFFSVEMSQTYIVTYKTVGDRLYISEEQVERALDSTWGTTNSVSMKKITLDNTEQYVNLSRD